MSEPLTLKTTPEQREEWREQNRFTEITMDGSILDMLLDDADTAAPLQQENARLQSLLYKYGDHSPICPSYDVMVSVSNCDCGWAAIEPDVVVAHDEVMEENTRLQLEQQTAIDLLAGEHPDISTLEQACHLMNRENTKIHQENAVLKLRLAKAEQALTRPVGEILYARDWREKWEKAQPELERLQADRAALIQALCRKVGYPDGKGRNIYIEVNEHIVQYNQSDDGKEEWYSCFKSNQISGTDYPTAELAIESALKVDDKSAKEGKEE